jgi:hypothetical protein
LRERRERIGHNGPEVSTRRNGREMSGCTKGEIGTSCQFLKRKSAGQARKITVAHKTTESQISS